MDVQSDFGKSFVRKKLVRWNHSYIKYALNLDRCIKRVFSLKKFVSLPYRSVQKSYARYKMFKPSPCTKQRYVLRDLNFAQWQAAVPCIGYFYSRDKGQLTCQQIYNVEFADLHLYIFFQIYCQRRIEKIFTIIDRVRITDTLERLKKSRGELLSGHSGHSGA